jgi:hypothetical protein
MRRLSYANVMSTVAVFIALGGGAVAATSLSSTPGVLTLCVGRTGSVKVLTGKRCAKGTKSVAVNERGIQGAPGPAGPTGPAGTAGPGGTGGTGAGQTYSAGAGLLLSNSNVFSPDLTALQARIAGSGCGSDQALQAVSQTGAPTCTSLHAYSATVPEVNGATNNVSVAVPAGTWLVLGQAEDANSSSSVSDYNCVLENHSTSFDNVDQALAAYDSASSYAYHATVSPLATTTTTGPSTILTFLCTQEFASNGDSNSQAANGPLSLIALPLAALD